MPKLTGKDFEYLTNTKGVSMVCGGDTDSVSNDTRTSFEAPWFLDSSSIVAFFL